MLGFGLRAPRARIPVSVGPVTPQHEGDTAFKLRAPLPAPRHRGEEGKRPRVARLRGRSGGPAAQTWPSQAPEPLGAAGAFLAPQVFLGSIGFFLQLESPQRLPVPGLPVSPCCGGVVGIHVPAGA